MKMPMRQAVSRPAGPNPTAVASVLLFAASVVVLFSPTRVSACSSGIVDGLGHPACTSFSLRFVGGLVPANIPQLNLWAPDDVKDWSVRLEGAPFGEDNPTPFTDFHWGVHDEGPALVFDAPLEPDSHYRLIGQAPCQDEPVELEFETTRAVDMPTHLGTVEITADQRPMTLFDTYKCEQVEFDAAVGDIHILWDPSSEPWRQAIEWEARVDGTSYVRTVGDGPGKLYVPCGEDGWGGVPAGEHEVTVIGRLPGGEPLSAMPVSITLTCPGAGGPSGHEGAGCTVARKGGGPGGAVLGLFVAMLALVGARRSIARR